MFHYCCRVPSLLTTKSNFGTRACDVTYIEETLKPRPELQPKKWQIKDTLAPCYRSGYGQKYWTAYQFMNQRCPEISHSRIKWMTSQVSARAVNRVKKKWKNRDKLQHRTVRSAPPILLPNVLDTLKHDKYHVTIKYTNILPEVQ